MTEPTDAEIFVVAREAGLLPDNSHPAPETRAARKHSNAVQAFARAVLTKWGTPPVVAGEPVAYRHMHDDGWEYYDAPTGSDCPGCEPLYATPQPTQTQAGAVPQCWCLTCRPMRFDDPYSIRMALCPTCGNKRCPKANDHRNECTRSNEPGQPGSAYSGGIKGGQHVGKVD